MTTDMVRRWLSALVISAVLAATALAGRGQQASPQEPVATFRTAIEAVEIDVYATDEAGQPVSGLTVDDFELFENGVALPISTFTAVNIPIERAETVEREDAEPDVLTNNRPDGRVYVFALDEVLDANVLRTRHQVRQFIETHFGPHDIGAVVLLGRGLATDGQDFTSNRRLLLEAVDKFSGGFEGPRDAAAAADCGGGNREPRDVRTAGRSQQMASLRMLTELMGRMPGRHKALLLFTECLAVDVLDLVDYNGGVLGLAGEDAHVAMAGPPAATWPSTRSIRRG